MAKALISSLPAEELKGKRIFLRVDFNVPFQNGAISDSTRIEAALPTIAFLKESGCKIIIGSHLGRPKGKKDPSLSLAPVAKKLEALLSTPVNFIEDCQGEGVKTKVHSLSEGDVLVLENLRFYKEETDNNSDFAKSLASLADIFVNDAFGTAHRAHASTEGIARHIPGYLGLLFHKEVDTLSGILSSPKRPFMAIIGGAKISSKIEVVVNLMDKVDIIVIGGGMAYTFLKAQGHAIGNSLCEDEFIEEAKRIIDAATKKNVKLILPVDHKAVTDFADASTLIITPDVEIADGFSAIDVGPKTVSIIQAALPENGTVLWNGPLGVFEIPDYAKGTVAIAESLAHNKSMTVVGGGDSVSAIKQAGLGKYISHISTGGGASLEFLEGKALPGLTILRDS